MSIRALTGVLALLCGALLAACATPAPDAAEARAEPVYRTGSNLPVKDGTPSRVISAKPDDTPRIPSMPMPRPGGGG